MRCVPWTLGESELHETTHQYWYYTVPVPHVEISQAICERNEPCTSSGTGQIPLLLVAGNSSRLCFYINVILCNIYLASMLCLTWCTGSSFAKIFPCSLRLPHSLHPPCPAKSLANSHSGRSHSAMPWKMKPWAMIGSMMPRKWPGSFRQPQTPFLLLEGSSREPQVFSSPYSNLFRWIPYLYCDVHVLNRF